MNRIARASCRHAWCVAAITLSIVFGTPQCPAAEKRDDWQQPDRVVADLNLGSGAVVADVGAGLGYFTFRLAAAVGEKGKVFATDIDTKALAAVKEQAEKQKVKNVETVPGEPTDTKLAPASADAALLCDVLHHVPEAQRAALVQNVAQAIKPGGLLFIIDWRDKPEVPFDRGRHIPLENLLKLATDAGLVLDAEFHYLKHQVFLRFRKPPQP
jgi:ubiquinone/menaquinone biosynthesis C-methylase UbiE